MGFLLSSGNKGNIFMTSPAAVSVAVLLFLALPALCDAQQLQGVRLTSTEDSITLTFTPNPAATNYTVSFRLSSSFFITDIPLEPPYNDSVLTVSYDSVVPGFRYTVEIFENRTASEYKVFEQEIATVPLSPENVQVTSRGTSYLYLQWISTQNLTYESYEITYIRENGSLRVEEGSSDLTFNLTDLEAGYSYDIYVVAVTLGARSQRSDVIVTSTIPLPPVNVKARAVGSSGINITWEADISSFQEIFDVRYSLPGSQLEQNASCTESPCLFTPSSRAGETIMISVYSVSHSYFSTPASIQHSTAPGVVTGLEADEGVGSLHLRWNAPVNSVQVNYLVTVTSIVDQVSQDFLIPAAETSYSLDSLKGGYIFNIQIQAKSQFELGDPSSEIFRTLPEPVTNLTGRALNTSSIHLMWINPTNSEIDSLNITVFTSDGEVVMSTEESDLTLTSYTATNLLPGVKYAVSITVLSTYTDGSEEVVTFVRTKPVPPAIIAVDASETVLNITMVPSADAGILSSIQAMLEGGVVQHIADVDGLVTFSDLEPGTAYTVKAFSLSDDVLSDEITRTLYTRPQSARDLFVVSEGERSVSVTWSGPELGGFDNFTVVVRDVDAITSPMSLSTTNLEASFDDLQPGTTYNVTVMTVKGDQTSAEIWELNTTTPLPVTHLRVSVRGIDTVTLAWDAPAGSALSGFALTFDPLNLTLLPLPVEVDQYKLEGLEPDTNYSALAFTFSRLPQGGLVYSTATAFNFSTYPESVAALQKVEALTNSITVNWTAPTSVNIDFFQLGIKAEDPTTRPDQRPLNVPKTLTNTTFEDLEPGLEYTIAIRTAKVFPGGRTQYGVSVRLQAVTKPLPVKDLVVETVNTTAIVLNWDTESTSQQDRFRITYTADDSSRSLTLAARNESGLSYEMDVGQLLAGYSYSVTVLAIRSIETDLAESEEVNAIGFTVPFPVRNLTLSPDGSDLLVAWSSPASGKWKSYKVQYRAVLRYNESDFLLRTSREEQNSMRIPDLFPGEMYEVRVASVSNDLDSELQEATAVLSPLPPTNFMHIKDLTTSTSITLTWSYDTEATYTDLWRVDISAGAVTEAQTVAASTKETEYNLPLDLLVPGETYSFSITALVMEQQSQTKTLTATTKPIISSLLTPRPSTNSSISLSYSVLKEDIFDHLLFTLLDHPSFDQILKTKEDLKQSITFDGLEAGTKYTVRAATVSRGETSEPKMLDLITDPNPVPVTISSTSSSIKLTLGPQVGQAVEYAISCSSSEEDDNGQSCGQRSIGAGTEIQEVSFEDLRPYRSYSFEVVTRAEMLRGIQEEVSMEYEYRTAEAAPSAVRSLAVVARSIHSVILAWEAPQTANGVLRSYRVAYLGNEPTDPEERDMRIINDIPVTSLSLEIDNLRAGFNYKFSVFAITIAQGEVAEKSITLGTSAPVFKSGLSAVKAKPALMEASGGGSSAVTETKIPLSFTNPFSNRNGNIRYFTVIVSKDPSAVNSNPTLPSWSDAQADKTLKLYQTLGQCEDFFSSGSTCGKEAGVRQRRAVNKLDSRTFVIGDETNCEGKTYCNGPLLADTEYYVKLRGFTASGEFEETAYSEKIRTARGSTSNGGLIGGVVTTVVVVIVVMVIAVVMTLRRRRRPKRATKHVGPKTNWEQSTMCKFSRPVKLADFPMHVRKMSADSDFKYAEEYEDLKEVGRDQPCLAAEFPPNRPKNRFTNILPYDHSRVKLLPTDDDEGSDYINANYMPGFNSKREYIATQGPLPATRDDFWRMLWEQSSRNIVMLTRCQEKGREKSDHYWPSDSDPKFYGDLQIVILNETHMPDWTVTEFKVSLGEKSRNVRHFHYRVWPDFGVPKDLTSLIRFARMVREKLVREGGPIITHCSAGVGRSGTFIVLDHLLQMIREKDEVDIFSIVYKLRKERVLMVQTERFRPRAELQEYFSLQQYKFVHECLLCVLEGKEDDTTYANVGQINVGFDDDEGINVVEVP